MTSKLRDEGLITFQDRVTTFPDFSRFAEFAEFDPSYLHPDRSRRVRSAAGSGAVAI